MVLLRCPSCKNKFSPANYTKHFRTSQRSGCRRLRDQITRIGQSVAAAKAEAKAAKASSQASGGIPETAGDTPSPEPTRQFTGDFFGAAEEYTAADFGMDLSDTNDNNCPDDGDEFGLQEPGVDADDGNEGEDQGDGDRMFGAADDWEPPARSPPPAGQVPEGSDISGLAFGASAENQDRRGSVEQGLKGDPIVEQFPLDSAGAPVGEAEAGASLYEDLHQRLAAESPGNIHAPFVSELDMMFAIWAKNRGPGSTAVNEFLKIDGVRFNAPQMLSVKF